MARGPVDTKHSMTLKTPHFVSCVSTIGMELGLHIRPPFTARNADQQERQSPDRFANPPLASIRPIILKEASGMHLSVLSALARLDLALDRGDSFGSDA